MLVVLSAFDSSVLFSCADPLDLSIKSIDRSTHDDSVDRPASMSSAGKFNNKILSFLVLKRIYFTREYPSTFLLPPKSSSVSNTVAPKPPNQIMSTI